MRILASHVLSRRQTDLPPKPHRWLPTQAAMPMLPTPPPRETLVCRRRSTPPHPCPRSWQPGVVDRGSWTGPPCTSTAKDHPESERTCNNRRRYEYIWTTDEYLGKYLRSTPAHHRHPMSRRNLTDEQERCGPHIICDSCYCGTGPGSTVIDLRLIVPALLREISSTQSTLGLPLPHGTGSRCHLHKISTPPTFSVRHPLAISVIQTYTSCINRRGDLGIV